MSKINRVIKKPFFGKKAFQPFFRKLFNLSLEGMNIGTGGGSLADTGEAWAIRFCLKDKGRPVVFDVGAQGGEYLKEVLSVSNSRASVHAFEPNSRDFRKLVDAVGDAAHIYNMALGESSGRIKLYSGAEGLSSVYKNAKETGSEEEVSVETIDSFCKKNNIDNIDLLKLDVEGHELSCLKGARAMLPCIENIQFEMSVRSRDARVYFKDIFECLSGYTIYRVLKDGLEEISSPDKASELLYTSNYLAVRKP